MEEENPALTTKEEEPPKKVETTMSITTEAAQVVPLEDENLALVAEEAPKKFEVMMTKEDGEEEEHKKFVVGGQEDEGMGLKGKDGAFGSLEAKNDEEQGGGGKDDDGDCEAVEEANGGSLDKREAMKDDDDSESAMQDTEVVVNMMEVEPTLESKSSENSEFWVEGTTLASPGVSLGVDKGNLREAREEEKVGDAVETKALNKLADDKKSTVVEEKKSEPEGDQEEEMGYEGDDGGELGEEKEVDPSAISVEACEDKESPFAKANDELGYKKEINNDIVVVEGDETLKESTQKDGVEDEVAKPELMSKASTVVMNHQSNFIDNDVGATSITNNSIDAPIQVVHVGSIKDVDPASEDYVLKYSLMKEQDVDSQATANEVVEVVGVEKPLEVENIDTGVEDIGIDDCTEIENIVAVTKGVDVEKPREVENAVVCSDINILSQELALESSKENNDLDEDEGAIEVVDHEEQVGDDCIIETMLDVTNDKNDESKGGRDDGRKVEKVEEDTKGRILSMVDVVKDDDGSELVAQHIADISMLQPAPELTIESKSKNSKMGEDDASMASHYAPKLEDKGEMCVEEEEKVRVKIETNVADKYADDANVEVAKDVKLEQQGKKSEAVGYGDWDGGQLGRENKAKVFIVSAETDEPEDKIAIFTEPNSELGYVKEETNDIMVMRYGETPKESIEMDVNVEDEDVECDIEVVDHEDQVDDDNTFEAVTNVIEVENDKVEDDRGGDDGWELEEAIEDAKGGALGAVEAIKDDGKRELVAQDIEVDVSMVEPTPALIVEPKSDNSEFRKEEDVIASLDTLQGEDNGELREEVGATVETKVIEAMVKLELEHEESEKVGYGGGNGGELGKENEAKVPAIRVVAAELEDLLAPFAKANCALAFEKEENNDIVTLRGEEATKESTEKNVDIEDDTTKLEPACEMSVVVAHGGNIKDVDLASADSMLNGSLGKEQSIEGLTTASEVINDVGVDKLLEIKHIAIAIEDIGIKKTTENKHIVAVEGTNVKPYPISEPSIVVSPQSNFVASNVGPTKNVNNSIDASIKVVHDGSVKEVDLESDSMLEDRPRKEKNDEDLATLSQALEDVDVEKHFQVENIADTIEDISVEKSTEIESVVVVEADDVKPETMSKMSIVIIHDGSKVDLASEDNVLEDSPRKKQNDKALVTTGEMMEDVSIKKHLEAKNIVATVEYVSVEKPTEVEDVVALEGVDVKHEPTSEASIMVLHNGSKKEVDLASVDIVLEDSPQKERNAEGLKVASEVIEYVGIEKTLEVENIIVAVEDIGVEKPTEIENVVAIECTDFKLKLVSEVVHDGSVKEDDPVRANRVLEDCPWKKQNVEGLVTTSEVLDDVGVEKPIEVENIVTVVEDTGMEMFIEIENVVAIEGVDVNLESVSEPSIMIMHDGSIKEVDPTRVDNVHEDSPWNEQDAKGLASASEAVDDFVVEKPLEVENIATAVEDKIENVIPVEGVNVKPESTSVASRMVVHDGNVKEVYQASVNRVLEDSHWKERNVEGPVIASELVEDLGVEKPLQVENIATILENIGVEKSIEIENIVTVEGVDCKPNKAANEARIVIVHEGSIKEVDPASRDSMHEDSPWKEQNAKGLASASEAVEDFGVEKPIEVENIVVAVEDIIVVKPTEIENVIPVEGVDVKLESTSETTIVIVHDGSVKKFDRASVDSVLEDSHGKEQNVEGLVTTSEAVDDVDVDMLFEIENIDVTVEDIGVEKSIEIENGVAINGIDVKPKPASEIVHDGSIKEVDLASGYNVLEDSPWREKNAEILASGSEVVEDFGVEKPFDVENIADLVEEIGVVKSTEIENAIPTRGVYVKPESTSEASIVVVHDGSIKVFEQASADSVLEDGHGEEQNVEGLATTSKAVEDVDVDMLLEVENIDADVEDIGVEKSVEIENVVAIEGIFVKPEPSSEASIVIVHDGSIKEVDLATGDNMLEDSPWTEQNAKRLASANEAAEDFGVESLFSTSELALTAYPAEEMNEEEKKLHNKVELIRIKFLRLVYRMGATLGETVLAQVLYRLSLAEGINHGMKTTRAFSLDYAWKKALILEAEGKEDLNFSCNILVLGKAGVGKSATINSIFGEEKLKTDAFSSTTTSMREIVGYVHGVKIRIIDTPGLRPSVMDQGSNRKILAAVKKYTKKCPPDIVLYVDRLDCLSRDHSDLPLLKTITAILGSSIWFDAIVALTHAASAPPEGLNDAPMTYDVIMAQSSHVIQQSIRQAAGDMRLMNPVALVENHTSCRRNSEGQKVLPNGQSWRHQMLLLCYSSKILSEANSLLKLQDPNHEKLHDLHFLFSSLLQSRAHPKLSVEHGGNEGNSDIELDGYSDVEQANDEQEYDQLPPLPDMTLPPSFDCDNPTYRYRFLEPTSTVQARPVIDAHGWDHDCGYDGISLEETLAILNRFPANVAVQVTKNKKEFSIHLDSSVAAKHGENASSLAGFDIQTVRRQLAYILHGETKIKNIKRNRTTGGFLVTFLGDSVATGLRVEDQLSLGKRLSLVARAGAMRAQGDTVSGANLEARLKNRGCPIGQSLSTLGLSLMKWRQDLALGANLQSQFSIGMGSKMALHLGLNNKLSGQIAVKAGTSEQVQIALLGLVPFAASIYRCFRPS